MDFRGVAPGDIVWRKGGRQGSVFAETAGGKKVAAQTPRCRCSVSLHAPGMYRVDLTLNEAVPAHAAFAAWIADIEDHADRSDGSWKDGLSRSTCVYRGNYRLMVFSDTLVFDDKGSLSADLTSAKECAAIVELTGAWTSAAKWGLRWKVAELRFWTTATPELDSRPDADDDAAATEECMFPDDD